MSTENFSYNFYRKLITQLKEHSYTIADYTDYKEFSRSCILRHDIDFDISKAVDMAEVEHAMGVYSTFFVLIRSDFYNAFSYGSSVMLKRILDLGCKIGLHFDETSYPDAIGDPQKVIQLILREKDILSDLLGIEVNTVSMHQPSREIIEAELDIPGMINSYKADFFKESKYVSDSCRNWREPVEEIIQSEEYDRLHILTHAFWWNNEDINIHDSLYSLVNSANRQRYDALMVQVKEYGKILAREEIR